MVMEDLRWVRILSRPTNFCSIPRVIKISYGELDYLVTIGVEETCLDGDEERLGSLANLDLGINPNEPMMFPVTLPDSGGVPDSVRTIVSVWYKEGSKFELRSGIKVEGLREEGDMMCFF